MIPGHIQEELAKMNKAQRTKFDELVLWASQSGGVEFGVLPVDYERLIEMVRKMGDTPLEPVAPIIAEDPNYNFRDYFKAPGVKK